MRLAFELVDDLGLVVGRMESDSGNVVQAVNSLTGFSYEDLMLAMSTCCCGMVVVALVFLFLEMGTKRPIHLLGLVYLLVMICGTRKFLIVLFTL